MRKYLVGVAAAAAGVALAMPATAQDDMDMEHAHMSISGIHEPTTSGSAAGPAGRARSRPTTFTWTSVPS